MNKTRKRKTSQIRRLMKLARLLSFDEIDEDAVDRAKKELLKVLNAEYTQRPSSEESSMNGPKSKSIL